MSNKAKEYYSGLIDFEGLSTEDKDKFLTERGLNNRSYNDVVKIYKNSKFKEAFGKRPDYDQLKKLSFSQRELLLQEDAALKTKEKFFNEESVGAENANKINGLTPQGLQDLIESGWDMDDYIHMFDVSTMAASGATVGALIGGGIAAIGAGSVSFGAGAVPAAAAGAWSGGWLGAKIGMGIGIAGAAIESYWNNDVNSKLDGIVAEDNVRKEAMASKILPQVSSMLDNVISGAALKDEESRSEAMPIIKALQAYGVDVNKAEGASIDKMFDKVVAQNNPYWEMFKDRHELSDITKGDKLAMIQKTLATDLTFQDGGYSSSSINSQNIQNHISNNQSWDDWAYNTGKNLVVGTMGALGETVAGTAALGAYAIDKSTEFGDYVGMPVTPTNFTQNILEGKKDNGEEMPLLLNLSYWDGVDKFNTFDSDLINHIRETGGISPYNNVTLAGEEGKFFSWQSLNEAVKMGKYAAATFATARVLGAASEGLSKFTTRTAKALGASAATSETMGTFTGKFGAMGTYLAAGVPVSAGYGLGAYENVKSELSQKEDEKQARILLENYMKGSEYQKKVAEIEHSLLNPKRNAEMGEYTLYTKEAARKAAEEQVQSEMARYFTKYVRENRDAMAETDPRFKASRDNIEKLAVDAYALDATIEGAKNTFVNMNFRSYLFNKSTTEMLKGEATTPVRYNTNTNKVEQVSKGFLGKDVKPNARLDIARAVGKQVWGGFYSNYTDDITTGFVEAAAKKRYDNYLEQRYNGEAVGSLARYMGNLYDVARAALEGAEVSARDTQSWYDGFIGALGTITPGSGGFPALSRYNTGTGKRGFGSKMLERAARTSGIGATAYDTYYQHKNTAAEVKEVNTLLQERKMDLLTLLDFASVTNAADISEEAGPLKDAKSDRTRAFLTALLYIERNKDNPVVMAAPQLQRWLKLAESLRKKDFIGSKEYDKVVGELAQEFLSQSANADIAALPEEEAMKKATERIEHNLSKTQKLIQSMDEASKDIKQLNPKASHDRINYMTTLKVMADQYKDRINDMEEELGLSQDSSLKGTVTAEGMLARYSTRSGIEKRLVGLNAQYAQLEAELKELKEAKNKKKKKKFVPLRDKILSEHKKTVIKRMMNEIRLEKEAGEKALSKYFASENETTDKVLSKEEILALDGTSRNMLMSRQGWNNVSAEQVKVVEDMRKEYNEKGINSIELFNDLEDLRIMYDANMEMYSDNRRSPVLFEEKLLQKQEIFNDSLNEAWAAAEGWDLARKLREMAGTHDSESIVSFLRTQRGLGALKWIKKNAEGLFTDEVDEAIKFIEEQGKVRADIIKFLYGANVIEESDDVTRDAFFGTLNYLSSQGIDVLSDEALDALTRQDENGKYLLENSLDRFGKAASIPIGEIIQTFKNIMELYKSHKKELEANAAPVVPAPTTAEQSAPDQAPEPASSEYPSTGNIIEGYPISLLSLLEGGPDAIPHIGYFLNAVAAAFPAVRDEILAIKGNFSPEVLSSLPSGYTTDAPGYTDIEALVRSAYGDEGVAILGELMKNNTGFSPAYGKVVGERIKALKPVTPPKTGTIFDNAATTADGSFLRPDGTPIGDVEVEGQSEKKQADDNSIIEAFKDNSNEQVATAARELLEAVKKNLRFSKEVKDEARDIVETLSKNSFETVEEFTEAVNSFANTKEIQSEEGISEVANLLKQATAKITESQTEAQTEAQTATDTSSERKDTPPMREEKSELERRRDAIYDMYPNSTYTSSFIASVNIDYLRQRYPNSAIVAYYDRYHIEEALIDGALENTSEILFITDPSLEEAGRRESSDYDHNTDLPIVAVVESADGPIEIEGKHYQPVGVMASTEQSKPGLTEEQRRQSEFSAGAAHMAPIRDLAKANKETIQFVKTSDGKPLVSKPYGPPKARPVDINYRGRNDVIEIGINDLPQSERTQVQASSKAARRNSPSYQRAKRNFLKRLITRDLGSRIGIFFTQSRLNGQSNYIEIFTKPINETTAKDSNVTFAEAAASNDPSAIIKFNSRTSRAARVLENFIESFSADEMIFNLDEKGQIVPSDATKSTLSRLAASFELKLSNFINIPSNFGWAISISPTMDVVGENRVMEISLVNANTGQTISLARMYAGMTKAEVQAAQVEFLKNLILDNGSVRMLNERDSFAKWNVPYSDVVQSREGNKAATENLSDIYDDGILSAPATTFNYRVQGIAVQNPLKADGTPVFTQVANPTNAAPAVPIDRPTVIANDQANSRGAIVDSESGTVLEGTPAAPTNSAQENAARTAKLISEDSSHINLTEDKSGYIDDRDETRFARVTSIISADEWAGKRLDPESGWARPSTCIGNGMDEFTRDFFAGVVEGRMDELERYYPNANKRQLKEFAEQLAVLRNYFIANGLTIIPREVKVYGEISVEDEKGNTRLINVAGTLDLLAYDTEGNFYIFDMKTHRSDGISKEKKERYERQLSLYKDLLEARYGIKVKGMQLIPIHVQYPTPKGEKADGEVGTAEYTESTELKDQLLIGGKTFRNAKPTLEKLIPADYRELHLVWNKLTKEERAMAKGLVEALEAQSETAEPVTPVEATIPEPETPPTDSTLGVPFDDSYLGPMFGTELVPGDFNAEIEKRTTPVPEKFKWENLKPEQVENLEIMGYSSTLWHDLTDSEMEQILECME